MVTSDGSSVGTVAQIEGDKSADIFDGLAVESGEPKQVRYVAGEQVGAIYPGEVTLKIAAAEAASLAPFEAAAAADDLAAGQGVAGGHGSRTNCAARLGLRDG